MPLWWTGGLIAGFHVVSICVSHAGESTGFCAGRKSDCGKEKAGALLTGLRLLGGGRWSRLLGSDPFCREIPARVYFSGDVPGIPGVVIKQDLALSLRADPV